MTIRHIIVEGPDGSGKTTLIDHLMKATGEGWDLHPRFSHSTDGPHANLFRLVNDDVPRMILRAGKPWLYHRHPLVSEYIYGPACRGSLAPGFEDTGWRKGITEHVAENALLVLCRPPWHIVNQQMKSGEHMAGVVDNAYRIYSDYARVLAEWPGVVIRYDRTVQNVDHLTQFLRKVSTS